jgi:uncharacterized lipoprotein
MDDLEREIRSMLAAKELTNIVADLDSCRRHIERALQHLETAAIAASTDPAAAVQLSYDAGRKALNAVLMLVGLKVHERAGSHGSYVRLSRLSHLNSEVWVGFEGLKKLRNQAEYGEHPIELSSSFASQIVDESRLMVLDAGTVVERFIQTAQGEP